VYGFSSLVKQNKKGKIYTVFSPEKENYFFNICDVITSPETEKSSANHCYMFLNVHRNSLCIGSPKWGLRRKWSGSSTMFLQWLYAVNILHSDFKQQLKIVNIDVKE
jgi:hypothetical protein